VATSGTKWRCVVWSCGHAGSPRRSAITRKTALGRCGAGASTTSLRQASG
jgi:hypothetical protein